MNKKSESTEKNQMKRLIICKLCHETLEDPIILPCGKTICSKHLLNETSNFKCGLCDNSHDKTVDMFPINEELNELVQICDNYVDLNSIDLGPEYNLAKNQCEHLKELINESELLIKDPSFYIDDYFTKLRNEIDLSREQLIEDIEHKYEKLINELKEIESKCKQNAQNKELNNKLEQTIEANKELLDKWIETLESNLNRGVYCENISNNSKISIGSLKYQLNKCKVALLDNKDYKFNSLIIEDPIFGDLETNEVEIIDESRLEGTVRFEIKDFSKIRYIFGKYRFIDQWFVVNNISWAIGVVMNVQNNDIYLSIWIGPLKSNQFLESNPIKNDVILKMIKKNGESYGEKLYKDYSFPSIVKFISLKDIMKPSNSLYIKKTDSITIEAKMRVID